MQLFIQHGYWKNELECLNRCWMYIYTIYISDICTATGDALEQFWWKNLILITSPYKWPVIPKPTTSKWSTWQCTLQQTILLGKRLMLPIPLGLWNNKSIATCKWSYSIINKVVYQHKNMGWHCHAQIP